ncbi:MAG: hypothetical protein II180_05720 [Proteobacteria bacterium]|nr:hypothetical protein [Pseudomonadota bacterium]
MLILGAAHTPVEKSGAAVGWALCGEVIMITIQKSGAAGRYGYESFLIMRHQWALRTAWEKQNKIPQKISKDEKTKSNILQTPRRDAALKSPEDLVSSHPVRKPRFFLKDVITPRS